MNGSTAETAAQSRLIETMSVHYLFAGYEIHVSYIIQTRNSAEGSGAQTHIRRELQLSFYENQ